MTRLLRVFLAMVIAALAQTAGAHEMSMAEMQLREVAPGEFLMQWGAGEKGSPRDVLTPVWPDGCNAVDNVLRCGPAGLTGTVSMQGVGKTYSAAMIKVFWQDGQTRVYTLTAGQPTVHLYGSAEDKRAMGEIALAYIVLGFEHIMGGFDHLLFVLGLLFLVGFRRQLVWTISAFTVAHSLSLASVALGWLTLRPTPVEACIALSIVLVASEALGHRKTLARQWPALVAFLFGLVHGMGFAGALKEIGLPENHMLVALLTFNLGVEIGQLAAVLAAWLVTRMLTALWPQVVRLRTPILYGVGSMGAYWTVLRVSALAGN
jgi:HupE / UreJ protein